MKSSRSLAKLPPALTLIGAGLLLLSAALWLGSAGLPDPFPSDQTSLSAPAQTDFPAPQLISLTDLDGEPVALEEYRGSVMLVNLWATWCPPCRAEMPVLEAFYRKYKNDGFVVLALNQREARADVEAFIAEQGLTFPVWLDLRGEAEMKFNTNALPSSYVADRSGRVRLAWIGEIDAAKLEQYVPPIIYETEK